MPWTLSHPAAVLPLRRFSPQTLEFAALVFGSMAPDLGYHIHQVGFATFAHTLPGTLLAAVPTGLMFLLIFYLVRRPVCYAFPRPHRAALLPLCAPFPRGLKRWLTILLSLLIGVWPATTTFPSRRHRRGHVVLSPGPQQFSRPSCSRHRLFSLAKAASCAINC